MQERGKIRQVDLWAWLRGYSRYPSFLSMASPALERLARVTAFGESSVYIIIALRWLWVHEDCIQDNRPKKYHSVQFVIMTITLSIN